MSGTGTVRAGIPAATLVLFRAITGGPDEHLMIERAAAMAFAGGALVFPGGRVDPGDRALAAAFPTIDPDDAAGRIAAIRETIEETGVAPAIEPAPDAATITQWRAALADGAAFAALLAQGGFTLQLERIVPFARWQPNFPEIRVFDTRFYVAEAPARSTPLADGSESVHAFWASARVVLDDAEAGRHRLIFPTRRNLERLATFDGYAAAAASAAVHPVRLIVPTVETRDGEEWLCIPADAGYPVTAERAEHARRA